MSKFVLVCARGGTSMADEELRRICSLVTPADVDVSPPVLRSRPGLTLAVVCPNPSVPMHQTSLCLGQMFGDQERWFAPAAPIPDGSFALLRSDDAHVEVVTDAVASRSVYFAATDDLFVASSSQRAVVAALGSFRLNPQAVSWMISSGTLGPGVSWDERVTRLGPDTRVLLDRSTWKVTTSHRPIVFEPESCNEQEHLFRLRDAVLSVCDGLNLRGQRWTVPLSGGHDSRILLLRLARRYPGIPCVTWGVRASLDDPRNDAHVAQRLARHLGVPHEFCAMDESRETAGVLFDRFLSNGEGCVENIGGYTDGFAVWRQLHDRGVTGVVRGDEGFGWEPVLVESAVRWAVGATMLPDVFPRERLESLGLTPQAWPAALERRSHESIATWRDRLYHAFRIPVVLASLTDLKTPYVEIVNPLLARRILEVVRSLPDDQRTDKKLFRTLVGSMSPPIPFASRPAIPRLRDVVAEAGMRALTRGELLASLEEGSLPAPFVEYVLTHYPAKPAARARRGPTSVAKAILKSAARRVLAPSLRSALLSLRAVSPGFGTLAFRGAIVSRMARELTRSAALLNPERALAARTLRA